MVDVSILNEVEKREEECAFIHRCLEVNVCPRCGHDVAHHPNAMGKLCPACNFRESAAEVFKRMYDESELKSRQR